MTGKKIIFMGTPEFAATILTHLIKNNICVAAVVTVADKPAGRGQKVTQSAVKQVAMNHNLPVLQPEKLKDSAFLNELASFQADLFVVVAFRMLPKEVWQMPPMGTINLHGSLLPQYRGAAPINRAVMNGETITGVTTFFIEEEIDTGAVIMRESLDIGPDETAGELHDRMMHLGAEVTLETVKRIFSGQLHAITQDQLTESELQPAPKLFKGDCRIDWNQPAEVIHNFVRGLSPYPAAWTTWKEMDEKTVKLFKTALCEHDNRSGIPGSTLVENGKMWVFTKTIPLEISELQIEGKKRVSAKEFLNGHQPNGHHFI
jgi:methionyl-tRNA formyltransferase